MIVRHLQDILNTERDIQTETWASRRLLLQEDGMGFSLHETTIFAGTQTHIWYKNHLEAVYCVKGEGEVELIPSGEIYKITPGTMYALNKHDNHYLRATTSDLVVVCAFNPPLVGTEVHDEDGVYATPEQMMQKAQEASSCT